MERVVGSDIKVILERYLLAIHAPKIMVVLYSAVETIRSVWIQV